MYTKKDIEKIKQEINDIITTYNKGDKTNFITSKKCLEYLRDSKKCTQLIKEYLKNSQISKIMLTGQTFGNSELDEVFLMPYENSKSIIEETNGYILYYDGTYEIKPKMFIETDKLSFEEMQQSPYFVESFIIPMTATIAYMLQNAIRLPFLPALDNSKDRTNNNLQIQSTYHYYLRRKTLLENALKDDEIVSIDIRMAIAYLCELLNVFELDSIKFEKTLSEYIKDKPAFIRKYDKNVHNLHNKTLN